MGTDDATRDRASGSSATRGALENGLSRGIGRALTPVGVTMAQLQVLTPLVDEPGMSGAQLARVRRVSPQTIHALLMATEERGWIRRSTDPENNRTLLAKLTPQGRRICAAGRENRARTGVPCTKYLRRQGGATGRSAALELDHKS